MLSWLGGIFLGMIVFTFNLITETRGVGTGIATAFVLWGSWTKYPTGMMRHRKLSPISWLTVDYIDVGGMTLHPTFTYCVTVFLVCIAVMAAAVLLFGCRKSLDFKE